MTTTLPNTPLDTGCDDLTGESEFDAMLRAAISAALPTTDFAAAFSVFFADLPLVAPGIALTVLDGNERSTAYSLFREIWNHLPRPENNWRPLLLPRPDRNAPCPCQSGKKFKQCCGGMEGSETPFAGRPPSLLGYVLETLPVSQYASLPFKRLMAEEVAHVAEGWITEGRVEPARLLLEGLLADGGKFDARHEYAFDTLCSLYVDAGEDDLRSALVERFMRVPDKLLKAAAMHRRCTILADLGDSAAAWAQFKEAQRLDPDNPSLAHLELSLHASEGHLEHAAERARYWAARLCKLGYGDERLVEFIDAVADDPRVLTEMMGSEAAGNGLEQGGEAASALGKLIAALPPPASHYRLSCDDRHGCLHPDVELSQLEATWLAMMGGHAEAIARGEFDPWQDISWIDWLAAHPLALQSFAVVEQLVSVLLDSVLPMAMDDLVDDLEAGLLAHAMTLLRIVVAANEAEKCALDWSWQGNRPALRLINQAIEIEADLEQALALGEWLVLELNPTDNTGNRELLAHHYCAAGRAADALALRARYPDDSLPAMAYVQVLALVLLDQRSEATLALATASKGHPKILKTLRAANPKMPPLSAQSPAPGSDEEAWLYRAHWHDVWEATGALRWLKSMTRG